MSSKIFWFRLHCHHNSFEDYRVLSSRTPLDNKSPTALHLDLLYLTLELLAESKEIFLHFNSKKMEGKLLSSDEDFSFHRTKLRAGKTQRRRRANIFLRTLLSVILCSSMNDDDDAPRSLSFPVSVKGRTTFARSLFISSAFRALQVFNFYSFHVSLAGVLQIPLHPSFRTTTNN